MSRICLERRLIGEILIERQLITREQLEKALEEQRRSAGTYVGEVLVRLGYVREVDIVTALVVQCNLPYIAVSKHEVAPEVVRLIPAEIAFRDRLVPLDRIGNILSIVMLNPMNENARQEVQALTGCRIATFISTRAEINQAIARLYGQEK